MFCGKEQVLIRRSKGNNDVRVSLPQSYRACLCFILHSRHIFVNPEWDNYNDLRRLSYIRAFIATATLTVELLAIAFASLGPIALQP